MVDFNEIQKKWQQRWEKENIFKVTEDSKKPKYYVLEMYPYPSASFLHMGHVRNYTIGDIYARFKRMNGFNVLYPMGYDSFGLPAEIAAKKEGIHPKKYTDDAIAKIMEYQKALGNSYDWSRVISSHDPDYYKWNQYFFIKLFEKGLVYRKKAPVNWCEHCQTVLANEEAEGGKCWRCENEVTKKDLEQWFFKITAYADRLLDDLDKIDWPEKIKTMQRNWIGKSYGTEIDFTINGKKWPIFTTRPDTIYGVTFMVISAQHPKLMELVTEEQKKEVEEFVKKCQKVRTQEEVENLDKEGVFTGSYAINPLTKEKVPVWVGNFVLADYGCGMVMAVPAHDQRDFEFAKKYKIPIKLVIQPYDYEINVERMSRAFVDEGILVNSGEFNGERSTDAIDLITKHLIKLKIGRKTKNYKIRDWLISRQRYWGTPIPMIHCPKCGIVPVPEKDLPVLLPEKVDFKATNPLASNPDFVNVKCPKCKSNAKRETDTMGGFMDSSWYFLRYCDNKNKDEPFDKKKIKYWMPVDQYIGGAEHAVMHLIYARFFVKALKDLKFVDFDEPFTRLFNQGIVYKDGAKMSKSKGNIVTQEEIAKKYGIDTARLFLMFMAAPDKLVEWSDKGIEGSFRFLQKVYSLVDRNKTDKIDNLTLSKMHRTIKEVTQQIEKFEYNKAIISLMAYANYLNELEEIPLESIKNLILLIAPFTPHLAEEMWEKIGNKGFVSLASWPKYDETKIDEEAEAGEEMIIGTISDIKSVLELAKIQKPNKIKLIVSPEWKYIFMIGLKKGMEYTRDVAELIKATMDKQHGAEISKLVPMLLKNENRIPKVVLDQKRELKILENKKSRIEKQFNCIVEIETAEQSKEEKAKNALPGKPAIVVQ